MVGESYQETQAAAVQMSARDGLVFVPPYDDPFTIAGQGTIADEIMRQIGDPEALDAIFVPIGGGGLIAGIAAFTKALWPKIKVGVLTTRTHTAGRDISEISSVDLY